MTKRTIAYLFLGLLILVALAGIAWYAYNLGIAQGVAESGNLPAPEAGGLPYRYYGGPFFFRPFGFGFGFLGCLFPILFFFLLFGLARAFFWHGHLYRHGFYRGRFDAEAPPGFEDWHRRMHEANGPDTPSSQQGVG